MSFWMERWTAKSTISRRGVERKNYGHRVGVEWLEEVLLLTDFNIIEI